MVALRTYPILLLLVLASGCANNLQRPASAPPYVPVQQALSEIPEERLLDVWIELFDSAPTPADAKGAKGLAGIRDAEGRYMPVHLRGVMEKTGYWGAVRVVPRGTEGSEVLVRGTILVSDGETLGLRVTALDATGRQWFEHSYELRASTRSYVGGAPAERDPFESLYNAIANDLARYRGGLGAEEIAGIRRVAALRFAADLAPQAYAGYLEHGADGAYRVRRLPAEDDPMYRRIQAIRERDLMLVDTLNGHFDNLYRSMQGPYQEWRKARVEEAASLREVERKATNRKIAGVAAILGAIAIEVLGNRNSGQSTSTLRNVMVAGGAYAIKTGYDLDSQSEIHRDAIQELDESFASETQPLVVEVEGETHELTGSAEVQYAKWRALLRRIYAAETGLVHDQE